MTTLQGFLISATGRRDRRQRSLKDPARPAAHTPERGATLVEFSFLFLTFLLLTLGLMEVGRCIWTYTTLAHASRQGARFALVHGGSNPAEDGQGNDVTEAKIADTVKENAIGLDPAKISVATTWTPDNQRGSFVDVEVTYSFEVVTGQFILPQGTIPLRARSRMIVAN